MPINLQPSTGTTRLLTKERTRGEGSRKMLNNSRPPLSHRIRASLERRKSQDAPTPNPKRASFPGSSPIDPEVFREAIDHAISGDAFQAGIASHIAGMLKPQIKTALDTIEPLVNAVLKHEMILKKTNASVESILLRLDSMTDEHGAVGLAGIQKSHESHEVHAVEGNAQPIDVSTPSVPTAEDADTLQSILTAVQKSNEAHEKQMAALESIQDSCSSAVILAEVQKLHVADAAAIESLKITSAPPPDSTTLIYLGVLESKMETILETSTSILAEVQKSNESHISHAAALESIKALPTPPLESSPASTTVDLEVLEKNMGSIIEKLDNHAAVLDEIKTKDLPGPGAIDASALDGHFGSITSLLEAHTMTLDEIKAKDIPVADVGPIISMLESHTAALDEIKSKDTLVTDFAPITSILEAHTATLDDIKSKDIPITDVGPIISMLESHTATLDEIKSKDIPIVDFAPITSILEAHTATLDEIKAKDEASKIDFSPITSVLESHTSTLDELKSKEIPTLDFTPVTSLLEAHSVILEDIKAKDGAPSIDFSPITSVLEAHSMILEDIKAKDGAPSIDFSPITSTLESHSAVLGEIKLKDIQATNTEAFDTHFSAITDMLAAHTVALDELKSKDISSDSSMPAGITNETLDKHFGSITSMLQGHTATLDEMKSKDVTASTGPTEFNTEVFDAHFNSLTSLLESHTAALDELKSKSNDSLPTILQTLSSHTSLLREIKKADFSDEILTALHELQESSSTSFNTLKESDVSDEILTALHTCNDSHERLDKSLLELQTVVKNLSENNSKNSVAADEGIPGPAVSVDLSGLETQVSTVIATLEGQNVILGELKDAANLGIEAHSLHITSLSEIKDVANASNQFHYTHSATLGVIRDATAALSNAHAIQISSLGELKEAINTCNEANNAYTGTLEEIRDATAHSKEAYITHATILGELKEAINTSNESHSEHTNTLGEIRDATTSSNEAHITHTTALGELKEAMNASIESHTSHTTALDDLKSIQQTTQQSLDTIVEPRPAPVFDTSALDTQLATIITALESQTSTLGEIKEVHTSHMTTLGDIKDATIASNESHASHTAILSDIKDATAPVHGINEALNTHTVLLEGLKDGSQSKHDEMRSDIESLKKMVEENLSKHEENISKHDDLIREHRDLVRVNLDGLEGAIAGLALGGVVGAGVVKVVGGDDGTNATPIEDKVPEDIPIEPEAQIEEETTPDEEFTPIEPENPVEKELVSETEELEPKVLVTEEDTPAVEESSITPGDLEAQPEPEVTVDEEEAADETGDQEPGPEVIHTEPEVMAEPQAEVSTIDPAQTEPELEPVAIVEEAPIEEPASTEFENLIEEPVAEISIKAEEEPESATVDSPDEMLSVEQKAENDFDAEKTLQEEPVSVETDVLSEPEPELEPSSEASAPTSNMEPTATQQLQETDDSTREITEESTPIQETDVVEDLQTSGEFEVVEKVKSNPSEIVEDPQIPETTESTPEEDSVPESPKDEPGSEQSATVEEIPVEKKVAEVEEPKEERDGESKGVEVHGDVIDDHDSKATEEIVTDTKDKESQPNDEEKSVEEATPVVVIENLAVALEETIPLETDKTPPAPEEVNLPTLDNMSAESKEHAVLQGQIEPLIPEASHAISADHVEIPIEHEVTKSTSEDPSIFTETETKQPTEIEEKVLETDNNDLGSGNVLSEATENPIEPLQEKNILEPTFESETPIQEFSRLNDQNQPSEDSRDKALETEDLESKEEKSIESVQDESIPEPIVETEVPASRLDDQEETPIDSEEKLQANDHINEEISNETSESVIKSSQKDALETAREAETSLPDSNDQDQPPIENEDTSTEPTQANEYSNEDISSGATEISIEPLQEVGVLETNIETETPISSESKDQEQSPVEGNEGRTKVEISEPDVLDLESSEQPPLVEINEKSLEIENQEPGNETQPSESENNPVEPHEENAPDPAINTEIPVFESNDEEQAIAQSEEIPLEPELNEPVVKELESSEEQLPSPVDNEENATDMIMQDTIPDSAVENDSAPESSEEVQNIVEDEELPEPTEGRTVEILDEESVTKIQPSIINEEDHSAEIAPEEITVELEDENENPTDMTESSEEVQIVTGEESPISTDEQVIEAQSEEKVLGSEPLTPEPTIGEDAEEEVNSNDPMVEETNGKKGQNSLVGAEAIFGDEPKESDIGQNVKEPIDISDEQLPVESQESLEDLPEEEPLHTEVIDLQEQQGDSVVCDERPSELELERSLEEPAATATGLEGNFSPEEPEIETVQNTAIRPTEELVQEEDIISANTEANSEELAENQIQHEENETPSEKQSSKPFTEPEDSLEPELQKIVGGLENEDTSNETASAHAESVCEEWIQAENPESAPFEAPVKTEAKISDCGNLSDASASPIEIDENKSLPAQLESESAIELETQALDHKHVPDDVTLENGPKDTESKRVLEYNSAQENSTVELEPPIEGHPHVESADQELDDQLSSVEHIEVAETEPSPQDHSIDVDSVENEYSLPVEREVVCENLIDPIELGTNSIIRESRSNDITSSLLVEDHSTVDYSAQEVEHGEDVESAGFSGEIEHESEPIQIEIASETSVPRVLALYEPFRLEEEAGSMLAQGVIPAERHQTFEKIPVESKFVQRSSMVLDEDRTESVSDPITEEVPVVSGNEVLSEENVTLGSEPIIDTKETVVDERSGHALWDHIFQDQVESQITPKSEPQTPSIIEGVPEVPGSSEPDQDSVSIKYESLIDSGNPFEDPTDYRVNKDSQNFSDDISMRVKDDLRFEDSTSVHSQDFKPEFAMENYRQEQDHRSYEEYHEPTTSISDYIRTSRLELKPEPEAINFYSREPYLPHETQLDNSEASSQPKYSSFEESHLDTQSSFNYQDYDEQLEPEVENPYAGSRESYPAKASGFSDPEMLSEQRYSSYEEFSPVTRSSFNYQDYDKEPEPKRENSYADPSYPYDLFSKPYPTQDIQLNSYELEPEHPVTPRDQTTHEENIPPTPATALTTQISTEAFPTYDESQRSPVLHGFHLGLPTRSTERVGAIHESAQCTNESEYPMYNQLPRSTNPSRIPVPSTRPMDNFRQSLEFDDECTYPRYDEPMQLQSSTSPPGLNLGPQKRSPGLFNTTRHTPEFDNERTFSKYHEPEPLPPSRSSQAFRLGVPSRNPARVQHQGEDRETADARGNARSLLTQSEGGELLALPSVPPLHQDHMSGVSPYDWFGTSTTGAPQAQDRLRTSIPLTEDRFGTSIPRPLVTRSFKGKQIACEEEGEGEWGEEEQEEEEGSGIIPNGGRFVAQSWGRGGGSGLGGEGQGWNGDGDGDRDGDVEAIPKKRWSKGRK